MGLELLLDAWPALLASMGAAAGLAAWLWKTGTLVGSQTHEIEELGNRITEMKSSFCGANALLREVQLGMQSLSDQLVAFESARRDSSERVSLDMREAQAKLTAHEAEIARLRDASKRAEARDEKISERVRAVEKGG